MHECVLLLCIFGCRRGKYTLEHYLVCDIFLPLLLEHFVFTIGPGPLHRLNLINPTPQMFILITVMLNMYHTFKLGYRHCGHSHFSNEIWPMLPVAGRVAREYDNTLVYSTTFLGVTWPPMFNLTASDVLRMLYESCAIIDLTKNEQQPQQQIVVDLSQNRGGLKADLLAGVAGRSP